MGNNRKGAHTSSVKSDDLVTKDVVAWSQSGWDLDGGGEVVGGGDPVGGPDAVGVPLGVELGE